MTRTFSRYDIKLAAATGQQVCVKPLSYLGECLSLRVMKTGLNNTVRTFEAINYSYHAYYSVKHRNVKRARKTPAIYTLQRVPLTKNRWRAPFVFRN